MGTLFYLRILMIVLIVESTASWSKSLMKMFFGICFWVKFIWMYCFVIYSCFFIFSFSDGPPIFTTQSTFIYQSNFFSSYYLYSIPFTCPFSLGFD